MHEHLCEINKRKDYSFILIAKDFPGNSAYVQKSGLGLEKTRSLSQSLPEAREVKSQYHRPREGVIIDHDLLVMTLLVEFT